MPNRAHQKQFGRIFSTSLHQTIEKERFFGPALHVGSKINYDDDKARESVPRFRKFITSNLKENQEFFGLDIFPGYNVDIIADLCNKELFAGDLLQYKGYFKTIICWAVLEHVSNPIQAAINIDQFLAPGGKLFYCGPWVWGYHAYPDDYWRISFPGLKILFPHLEWQDWWYSGTKKDVAFRINQVKSERQVFLEKDENANQNNLVSDRYMPYLNINAIGIKKLS